jgi:hypothetical protein
MKVVADSPVRGINNLGGHFRRSVEAAGCPFADAKQRQSPRHNPARTASARCGVAGRFCSALVAPRHSRGEKCGLGGSAALSPDGLARGASSGDLAGEPPRDAILLPGVVPAGPLLGVAPVVAHADFGHQRHLEPAHLLHAGLDQRADLLQLFRRGERTPPGPDTISAVMAELGTRGGANSRKNLTPAERKGLARKAAKARWRKKA